MVLILSKNQSWLINITGKNVAKNLSCLHDHYRNQEPAISFKHWRGQPDNLVPLCRYQVIFKL